MPEGEREMCTEIPVAPNGWHFDDDTGALMRDVIHRMGRRCHNWDYCGRGSYQITITLAERRARLLGSLGYENGRGAFVELSDLGRKVDGFVRRIPEFCPEIDVLGVQMMPDHLHLVLRVNRPMKNPVGYAIRGLKGASTKAYWETLGFSAEAQGGVAPGLKSPGPLFAEGYVDTILFDETALDRELAYLADNPRRLWEKRAHPELFAVVRDLAVELEGGVVGHFSAIGNHHLLKASSILQVQCSRRFFAYRRDVNGDILRDREPRVASDEFRATCEALLDEAAHGAVLVSPCISEGEREIARRAFADGHKVITLSNKGFAPLYKPSGKLFDRCAAGNLLMLAPIGWPYLPGEKKMTRLDACVLNRIAQMLSGKGAIEIAYKGVVPSRVESLAREAVGASAEKQI